MTKKPETLVETHDLILELLRRLDGSGQTYTTFARDLMPDFEVTGRIADDAQRHLSNALRELVGFGRCLGRIG